jgi:hypothetical protein
MPNIPAANFQEAYRTPAAVAAALHDGKTHLLLAAALSPQSNYLLLFLHLYYVKHSSLSIQVVLTKSAARFLAGQSPEQPRVDRAVDEGFGDTPYRASPLGPPTGDRPNVCKSVSQGHWRPLRRSPNEYHSCVRQQLLKSEGGYSHCCASDEQYDVDSSLDCKTDSDTQ